MSRIVRCKYIYIYNIIYIYIMFIPELCVLLCTYIYDPLPYGSDVFT